MFFEILDYAKLVFHVSLGPEITSFDLFNLLNHIINLFVYLEYLRIHDSALNGSSKLLKTPHSLGSNPSYFLIILLCPLKFL